MNTSTERKKRSYLKTSALEINLVTDLFDQGIVAPKQIAESIMRGGHGNISFHYLSLTTQSAAKRVNGILTAAARSVGRTRLNDALASTQQPYDTEDYLTYADENTYYVSSAAEDRDMNVETLLQLMIQERGQQKP
ncbi:unnamed protein product [Didymodactylos carnosus]|uniref:Uncharacterized protein n=1 Tax=Didymodactylos carnosus TaxID=1234261 RepID=A0A815VG21_9BILA|nr:unnamed protein product [Didymodactylos carnosus]CAF4389220.1 unnamed protein product [Didymodactylos carnosus]